MRNFRLVSSRHSFGDLPFSENYKFVAGLFFQSACIEATVRCCYKAARTNLLFMPFLNWAQLPEHFVFFTFAFSIFRAGVLPLPRIGGGGRASDGKPPRRDGFRPASQSSRLTPVSTGAIRGQWHQPSTTSGTVCPVQSHQPSTAYGASHPLPVAPAIHANRTKAHRLARLRSTGIRTHRAFLNSNQQLVAPAIHYH